MKILLIEDDDPLIALLTRSLNSQHYIVDAVKDGEMGWIYASTFDYDSIVLDIMLPKLDGISLCKKLRGAGYTTPILLLTAQDNTTAKVQGLDAGADDYMVKPFEIAELIARVRALRRRGSNNPLPLLIWGDLMLDPITCEVTYNRQPLILTTKEYDLLELFLRDSARVFSSEEIIDRLWSSDDFPAAATVRSHLRRLRHKLQSAGAPPDAIGTIHGRGYYLKSPQSHGNGTDRQPERSPSLVSAIDILPGSDSLNGTESSDRDAQQQQYLAFIQETWVTTKPQCLERLTEIRAIVDRLLAGNCTYPEQQQAHQQAHKLVGTLGVLTLLDAMEIARRLEVILNRSILLSPTAAAILPTLVDELVKSIVQKTGYANETTAPSQIPPAANPDLPLLLLIAIDATLTQSLSAIAEHRGYRPISLSTIAAGVGYLTTITDLPSPPVIFIGLTDTQELTNVNLPLFDLMAKIDRQFSDRSVLVLSDRDESNDPPRSQLHQRLAVVRHGGKFLNTTGLTADRIFTAATARFPTASEVELKVMVVDDDLDWLRAMPKLLQPWGMKVTTLADPQQFWTVLQSVDPDALILDIKMPEINGFELCQVLRSDPHWQHLPILFLTAAQEAIAQQEAFNVGADDYLCKPVMGGELAHRIRHRLTRLRSLQS
ncbi:response regulator [Chamaesiphon sp. VAR_48_metabat_403]|uniref:response regulator n=1 Tax=Chamaesiphon sp. VAR_48_metabat_403 TaxID=2964700 RepID=UPI00286E4A8F|nr:response regulator [Chamaesiphon sp. VAR_48_metabat_403]